MTKVQVRNTRTGETQWVPEHWVGHPVLGKEFKPVTTGDKPAKQAAKKGEQDA